MTTQRNNANTRAMINNVFVLMLENRSFDHMLGFSGITGINGLTGNEKNFYKNTDYTVRSPADWSMPIDPGHEFIDTLYQLCGADAIYRSGGKYPPINNSGYVWDYVKSPSPHEGKAKDDFGDIMKCYQAQTQLPTLYTLATEFAVCDNWYSSMPGPTWPNRLFAYGGSSIGLDDSPSDTTVLLWEKNHAICFDNGSIFDALTARRKSWRIYGGLTFPPLGAFPIAAALKGVDRWSAFDSFEKDINDPDGYPYFYTLIEPNYGYTYNHSYVGGQSQHPTDDVRHGEALIKTAYEAIRNSRLWNNSLLIITYDEHGGFYDHAIPPAAVAPGDSTGLTMHGFTFEQLGVRVPAVVVSPFIPRNTVDHTLYDHASILARIMH
jgi:phospholipase C